MNKVETFVSAKELFDRAFSKPRDKRSYEYKRGVLDTLKYTLREVHSLRCPYGDETAESDAWYAGTLEGYALWRSFKTAIDK